MSYFPACKRFIIRYFVATLIISNACDARATEEYGLCGANNVYFDISEYSNKLTGSNEKTYPQTGETIYKSKYEDCMSSAKTQGRIVFSLLGGLLAPILIPKAINLDRFGSYATIFGTVALGVSIGYMFGGGLCRSHE